MPDTAVNGVELYYEIHGEGEPLVLVAGLASDSQSWQPVTEELSRHFRVITFDNRGVGRTKPQHVEGGIQQIADDCIALIKYLGLSSVNMLGHSMGGFVALDCAIRYPEYVSNLILAGTSAFISERNNALFHDWVSYLESGMKAERWFRNMFYWIFSKQFFDDNEVLDNALRMAVEYPYPQSTLAFKNQVDMMKAYNCAEKLARVKSKTIVICGKDDLLIPPEESVRVLQAIPGVDFSFIEGAAHAMHMEKPKEFIETIQQFLTRI